MVRDNSKNQNTLPPLNSERVYQLLAQKKWSELVELLHDYCKVIPSDYTLESAFKIFESEVIRNFDDFQKDKKFERNLRNLYLLHCGRLYLLSDVTINRLIVELSKVYDKKGDIEQAYSFASKLPQDDYCASLIKKYSQTLPKVVTHSQSQKIRVTENENISLINHTIGLFKSPQEHDFFMAIRDVFPMFMVYPNVALSTLINFEKIKSFLSSDEKNYFFKAVVDCVVFDQYKEYMPIYFFELDSATHDNESQRKRDRMKDNILAVAGQRLYRIRKLSHSQGQKEFMKLVSEVVLQ